MHKNIIIIATALLILNTSSLIALAKEYDCVRPNPNGKGSIGFKVDTDTTSPQQFNQILKTAKCEELHYATVKYGPGECRIHFTVNKDGKAKYRDVTGDTKAMNDYHLKCIQLLETTYPKSNPNIKIDNPYKKL